MNDVMTQLVFCENGSSVDTVFVNGEIVVQDGHLTRMDEKELLKQVNQLYEPMVQEINKEMKDAAIMEPSLSEMYFRVFGTD